MIEMKKERSRITLLLGLGILSIFSSCSKEEDPICDIPQPTILYESIRMQFDATAGGENMELLKTFSDPLGRSLNAELFKFYVSNVYFHAGNQKVKVKDVALITMLDPNFPDPSGILREIEMKVPYGNYDGISFGIGLDPLQNESDPNSFDPDHPLSSAQNTHWGTWSNYKFLMMEGKGDWDNDTQFTDIYGYHTGFDECYREVDFDYNVQVNGDDALPAPLLLTFEFNDIFFGKDSLDMAIFTSWHGDTSTIATSNLLSDNFSEALKIK
ncbi:MAG: hypothetical protein RIC15_12775 [Vicingaceae bacterium]